MIRPGIYGFERGYAYSVSIVESPQKPAPDGSLIYRVYRKDCNGRGVPYDGAYKRVRTYPPVQEFDDHRRLEDLQAGCCPWELAALILGDEGIPD